MLTGREHQLTRRWHQHWLEPDAGASIHMEMLQLYLQQGNCSLAQIKWRCIQLMCCHVLAPTWKPTANLQPLTHQCLSALLACVVLCSQTSHAGSHAPQQLPAGRWQELMPVSCSILEIGENEHSVTEKRRHPFLEAWVMRRCCNFSAVSHMQTLQACPHKQQHEEAISRCI